MLSAVVLLELENLDRHRVLRIRVSPPQRFSISHIHSMYDAPVTEEFEIREDRIWVRAVRTESPAVMEYYGFEDTEERHPVSRRLDALFLRARMGPPQSLRAGGREILFSDLAEAGDRVRISVLRVTLARYLLWRLLDTVRGKKGALARGRWGGLEG